MLPLISCVFLAQVVITPLASAALAPERPLSMEQQAAHLAMDLSKAVAALATMQQPVGPICSLRIVDAPGLDPRMVMQAGKDQDPGIARHPSCRPEEPARR